MFSNLMSGLGLTNVATNRNPKHKFKIVFKGAIPEPEKPAQTWPLLGQSALRFGKLPQGYIKQVQPYWLDPSNFTLSAETNRVEEAVGETEVSPALGPTFTPRGQDCLSTDFRSILQNITIRSMNEYYRNYIMNQLLLLKDFDKYINPSFKAAAQLRWTELGLHNAETSVKNDRIIEQTTAWTEPVNLIFKSNPPLPKLSKGSSFDLYNGTNGIDTNMEAFLTAASNGAWFSTAPSSGQQLEAFGMLHDQKTELADGLDIHTASQEVFGFPDAQCIERIESSPYIPFRIEWRAQATKKNKNPEPKRLPLGLPFIIRLFLRSPAPGGDKSRIHIDLGERLRLTIEQGQTLKLCRRRSEKEVRKYFAESLSLLTESERKAIIEDFDEASRGGIGGTGFAEATLPEPLSAIDKAEQMLEAYHISLQLYNTTTVENPGVYSDAIGSIQDQKQLLLKLRAEEIDIRKKYKDLSKKRARRKLSDNERIARAVALKTIRTNIKILKQTVGKNEPLRRKIANLTKALYSDVQTIYLQNTLILDHPLEIRITDYGVGIVLFDFNNGKDVHIFKDKEFLAANAKIKNKLGGRRSGGTGTNRVQVLGKESYTWSISEMKGTKEIGGRLRLSGNGGSFIFAFDETDVHDGVIYIPVAVNPELGIAQLGPSVPIGPITLDDEETIPPIARFDEVNAYVPDDLDIIPGLALLQDNEKILITNLPAYTDGAPLPKIPSKNSLLVDVDAGEVSWPETHRGGRIKVDIMPGVSGKTTVNIDEIPGYVEWQEINSTTSSTTPGGITTIKPVKFRARDFRYYMLRISFKPNRDVLGNAIGFPLLFRGVINVLANTKSWTEVDAENGVNNHTIIGGGVVDINANQREAYTINMETTFSEHKRRAVYQVSVTYKSNVPNDPLSKIPDWLVGLRCDILYLPPEKFDEVNDDSAWIPLVTDGYITASENQDMLAITQPNDSSSPIPIHGFYQYGLTKTTFNVADTLKVLEDKLMSEGLVLEGYHFFDALYTILRNSGFSEDKLEKIVNRNLSTSGGGGAYVNPNNLSEKHLPIAFPGSKHSFAISPERKRFSALQFITESLGYIPSGNVSIYVDREGKIDVAQPFTIGRDPRYDNTTMVYRTRAQVMRNHSDGSPTTYKESNYIYFSPLVRRRNLEEFYSVIKVSGAPDAKTGKPKIVGVKKKQAITTPNTNVYLGHHREMETVQLSEAKTDAELIDRLYHLYNLHTYPREIWQMETSFNPFLMPLDVIFVIPDNDGQAPMYGNIPYTSSWEPAVDNALGWNTVAWKVLDVSGNIEEDSMKVTLTPLNKEEKNILHRILQG